MVKLSGEKQTPYNPVSDAVPTPKEKQKENRKEQTDE